MFFNILTKLFLIYLIVFNCTACLPPKKTIVFSCINCHGCVLKSLDFIAKNKIDTSYRIILDSKCYLENLMNLEIF